MMFLWPYKNKQYASYKIRQENNGEYMIVLLFFDENDENLFGYFHDKYKRLLYKYIFDILKNNQDAEDALQQSWIKFAKNISKIKDQSEAKTVNYLVTIAKNTAIDVYQKKNSISEIENKVMMAIEENNHCDEYFLHLELEDLKTAIQQVDKKYIDVLLLKYVYGYTIKEIAQLMNISETNVGTRMERAKYKVKEKLLERRR